MTIYAELDPDYPDKIRVVNADWKYKELLNTVPAAKYKNENGPYGTWRFPLSWHVCLALKSIFKNNLEVSDGLKEWTTKLYTETILPCYTMRTMITPEGWENIMPDLKLFPHQKGDVAFLSTAKRAILANGLGSGKSQSSFAGVRQLYQNGEDVFPVLIACPNSTKIGWEKEILAVFPGLRVTVVDGNAAQRKKQLQYVDGKTPCVLHGPDAQPEPEEEAPVKGKKKKAPAKKQECTCGSHVVVINWESVRHHSKLAPYGSNALRRCVDCKGLDPKVTATSCEAHAKELNHIEFKTVIGDEIHRIMDPASKVSRAFKAATGNAKFRFGLSGTPIASNVENLFSPLNWLFPESFPSKTKFIDRMCLSVDTQWGKTVIGIRPELEEEFFQGLDPFLRRMPKEVILDFLPPILPERRDVQMGAKQKKAYEQMRDQMIAEVENGDIVYTTSPLTKLTRMLQFSSAYAELEYKDVYDPTTDSVISKPFVRLADPSCKLDAFMDDLPDYGDESLVIFAVSSQLINMLSARMEKLKIPHGLITGDQDAKTRQMHMNAFQEGKIKYILCTIAAGGTGITLTKGSSAIFLQRSWSMIENIQAEGRVHRIGSEQHDVIRIIDYVTTGSSEEIVFEAVANKTEQLEFILRDKDLMKKYLKAEPLDEEPEETEEENND